MSKAPIGHGHFTETGMVLTHYDPALRRKIMRKIVQITATYGGIVYALCDDGTLWWRGMTWGDEPWKHVVAIPQDGDDK